MCPNGVKPIKPDVANLSVTTHGSVFWNELSITPVFNEADQLTYFIGIQKDVSTEVEAQQRVRELEAEVAELKNQLAALQAKG